MREDKPKYRGSTVVVKNDDFNGALRTFKKKIIKNGLLQELRDRECYVKPSETRKRQKAKAKNRWHKYLRSQQLPPKLY